MINTIINVLNIIYIYKREKRNLYQEKTKNKRTIINKYYCNYNRIFYIYYYYDKDYNTHIVFIIVDRTIIVIYINHF